MEVTVVVGTFGTAGWISLARERAIPSAEAEGVPVVHCHAESLHEARNAGLAEVRTEFVIHLDADDELEPGYVRELSNSDADLRVPSVRYVSPGRVPAARVPQVSGHRHDCVPECLDAGNFIVIGAACRTRFLRHVGGWEPWDVYEDWAAWRRVWKAGASIEVVPSAVYRAHWRADSRNRSPNIELKNRVHYEIVAAT